MSERDPRDRQAAKTTIVGGQPPGNQRPMPPVPVGIEELLAMAAADEAFAALLLERRDEAIAASGVALTATERRIVGAVERRALQQMIANVDRALPEPERRAFLGRAAAALLAVVGGGIGAAAGAGCTRRAADRGPAADALPPRAPDQRPTRPMAGAVLDRPPIPRPVLPMAGEAADRPPDAAATRPNVAIGGLVADPQRKPDAGAPPEPKPAGIRPDRPRPTRGIRPDRPRPHHSRPTKGIRPDPTEPQLVDPFGERKKR